MHRSSLLLSTGLLFLIMGCATTSFIKFDDKEYFQESPKIVVKDNRFFLRWKFADSKTNLFAMFSESKVKNDSLFFFIPTTTSSGYMNGTLHLEEIKDLLKIRLISEKKAFWKNPNGSLNDLKVEATSSEDLIHLRD